MQMRTLHYYRLSINSQYQFPVIALCKRLYDAYDVSDAVQSSRTCSQRDMRFRKEAGTDK